MTFTAFGGNPWVAQVMRADGSDGLSARERITERHWRLGFLAQDAFKNPPANGGGLRLVFYDLPEGMTISPPIIMMPPPCMGPWISSSPTPTATTEQVADEIDGSPPASVAPPSATANSFSARTARLRCLYGDGGRRQRE